MKGGLLSASLMAVLVVPGTASAVGDATWSLASYRAMAVPKSASPTERIMAVYMASEERAEMVRRLTALYPTLIR
jgi:hypothetical protein